MRVSGVIFDCDGTLLDSMGVWLAAQQELGRRAGVSLTTEEVDVICTLTIPETGAFFHNRFNLGGSAEEVVDLIDEMMLDNYQSYVKARNGALDFVRELDILGIKCSVASSTPSALLQVGLEITGFTPYLSAIVSVDDAGASKREPAVYDLARKHMGTKKDSTWVFEDSVYALRTLKKAGYHTVGIYDNDVAGTVEELALADIVITDFDELDVARFVEL